MKIDCVTCNGTGLVPFYAGRRSCIDCHPNPNKLFVLRTSPQRSKEEDEPRGKPDIVIVYPR